MAQWMAQLMAPAVMLAITVLFTSLMLLPLKLYKAPSPVVNFYWRVFWIYLALISVVAGMINIVNIMGYNVIHISTPLLTGLMASYVCFVVFAWFRLVGMSALRILATIRK